ncbi:MFS transporter [Sulfolobus sp. S-194]|uniref:MFS transporter n=1 Tax=Sulfolobus sp. S-194 TaxID=2512240 RepID=UPI002570D27F|nr:MFS transporter [Sulfolobus sp. S-194]
MKVVRGKHEPIDLRFRVPRVSGLNAPKCVRFSEDDDKIMYVILLPESLGKIKYKIISIKHKWRKLVKISKFFLLKREARLYILSSTMAFFAARMIGTIMQPYLGIHLGFTIFQISLIFLIVAIVEGILTLSLGVLADFFNAYNLLTLFITMIDLGILIMILSDNFLSVLIAITLIYSGFSLRGVITRVLIGKRMSKDELSIYFTLTPLVTIISPLISSLIAQESYTIDLIVIFIIVITLIPNILRIRSIAPITEKHTPKIQIKEYIRLIKENRDGLLLPLLLAIIRFIFGTSFLYIPLYFTEIIKGNLLELGIMLSVDSIAITLASFPSKFLSDRLGNVTTLAMTRILGGITYALLYFVKSP